MACCISQEWYEYGKDVFVAKCAGSKTERWKEVSGACLGAILAA